MTKEGFVEACETALAMTDLGKVEELLAIVHAWRPGEITPYMRAQVERFGARLDAAKGNDPSAAMRSCIQDLRDLSLPFWTAVASTELAEWLLEHGRESEAVPLIEEARATFEQLRAAPWLERLNRSGALEALAQAT